MRYDTDNLKNTEEEAGPSSPDELFVYEVFPDEVFEGQGSAVEADDNLLVRSVPMVLFGQNLTSYTRITLSGDGILKQEVDAEVSEDGQWAAFDVRLPVIEDERGKTNVDLIIELVKGEERHEKRLVHHLLEELVGDNGGTLDTDRLATAEAPIARYSRIALNGSVTARGSQPLRLVGYAGISVSGILTAGGSGTTPGAGGCAGAQPSTDAECGSGSGKKGKNGNGGLGLAAGGGGGGAFGADDAGAGGGPDSQRGEAGQATGVPSLVPMPPATGSVRGAGGGGGGGPPDLLGHGGPGGGSGGILELTTPGLFDLSGFISADGAPGGPCQPGGGGGGGSGGAILLRAGAGLRFPPGNGVRLAARGGAGGACSDSPGGPGGSGLIRVDLPDAVAGDLTEPADPFTGPAFIASEIPVVATEPTLELTIRGRPGSSYELRHTSPDGTGGERIATDMVSTPEPEGIGERSVELWEGFNQLCVVVGGSPDPDLYPEAANCITVAYIQR